MATGRLGFITGGLTQNTLAQPYSVPSGFYTVFNISLTNTAAASCTIRIALSTSSTTPNIGEYIEYGTTVIGNGVFERTGLVAQAGIFVHVLTSADSGAMSCIVYGIETSTV